MHTSQQNNYIYETDATNPWHNLAVEEYLASLVKPGDVILYLWQNDPTVVIGRNQNALKECNVQKLDADGCFLARRATGGGAVYQDQGNLCFTFLASPERYDLEKQIEVVRRACQKYEISVHFTGRNDLVADDQRKISGNAFSVNSRCKLHHGTLLIHIDLDRLDQYLTPSQEKIQSKGIDSVRSRVCNLQEINPQMTVEGMKRALKDAYGEVYGDVSEYRSDQWDSKELDILYEKYASWEWRYGKSPECEIVHQRRFARGEVEVHLKLRNMCIAECIVYTDALELELPESVKKMLIGRRYDQKDVLACISECVKGLA